MDHLAGLRNEHTRVGLAEADASADPVEQFRRVVRGRPAANVREPSAATPATATPDGEPSARVALLKAHDRRGPVSCRRHRLGMGRERIVGGLRSLLNGLRVSGWAPIV